MATKRPTKKKMSTELPPQEHEVRVYDAQALLGYNSVASVRKLLELGGITARKIGRDLWFDTRSIERNLSEKRGVGRPREEAPKKKRLSKEEQERIKMREYQRERRARLAQGGGRKAAKRGASKKSAAGKPAAESKGRK